MENSAIGYSEGSEPIKLTDDKERLCRKSLQCLYIAVEPHVAQDVENNVSAYIESLKQQVKEEKNKAIDECIEALDFSYEVNSAIKIILESLKSDSK